MQCCDCKITKYIRNKVRRSKIRIHTSLHTWGGVKCYKPVIYEKPWCVKRYALHTNIPKNAINDELFMTTSAFYF